MRPEIRPSFLAIAILVVVSLALPVTWCTEQVEQTSSTEAALYSSSSSSSSTTRHQHHAGRNGTRSRHRGAGHAWRERDKADSTEDGSRGDGGGGGNSAICEMEISCTGGVRRHDEFTSVRLPVRLPIEVPRSGDKYSDWAPPSSAANAVRSPKKVAFFVGLSENIGPVTDSSPVMFDRIVTNVGAAYDSQTGRFTAPVNGTYQFNVVIAAQGRQKAAVNVVKNGAMVATVWAESIPYWSSASNVAVLELEPTDQVWLMLLTRASYLHGYMYSTFSGFLIFEHE